MFPDRDAGRTVSMPKRKSEAAGDGSCLAKTGVWRGALVSVNMEHGITGKRKWTKYTIEGEGGIAFTTFSHTDALLARCALEGGEHIFIEWKLDNWDGKSITAIGPEEDASNEHELNKWMDPKP